MFWLVTLPFRLLFGILAALGAGALLGLVVTALFVPLVISSGGNAGSQAATLVIRALALGEFRLRDWWKIMRRELAAPG